VAKILKFLNETGLGPEDLKMEVTLHGMIRDNRPYIIPVVDIKYYF
jgi:hypothetical protein